MDSISKRYGSNEKDGVELYWANSFVTSLKRCLENLRDGSQFIAISGAVGIGKTELMKLLNEGLGDAEFKVFSQNISGSLSSIELLQLFREKLNITGNFTSKISLLKQLQENIGLICQTCKVVVLLDDCEKLSSSEFFGDLKVIVDSVPNLSICFFGNSSYLNKFMQTYSQFEQRVEIVELSEYSERESWDFVHWLTRELHNSELSLPTWALELIVKLGQGNPGKIKMLTKIAFRERDEHKGKFMEDHITKYWGNQASFGI